MSKFKFITILLYLISVNAFYDTKSSKVEKLTQDNFKKKVLDSDEIWLVEFYAPWCGHCQSLAPQWDTAARKLKGVVRVGAIDLDNEANKAMGSQYGVSGFPTIKVFGLNKKKAPEPYEGERTAEAIVKHAVNKVQSEVMQRLKGKASSGSSKQSGSAGGGKQKAEAGQGGSDGHTGPDPHVVELTSSNFDSLVMGSKDIWFVMFYAPWCGHCKALAPDWSEAASKLKGQVKMGKLNADEYKEFGERFDFNSFPTLKVFEYGDKSKTKPQTYEGGRAVSDLVNFGNELAEKANIEPDVHEIIKQKVYDDNCKGTVICIITFLPNIYDSNANERKRYLDTFLQVAKKHRTSPFVYFWLQAGDQLDLERSLNLGFGFPAVIAISPQKKMIGIMRSSYSQKNVNAFLDGLLIGKGGLTKLTTEMKFKKADKWDGKDAPVIEEEDYGTEYDTHDEL